MPVAKIAKNTKPDNKVKTKLARMIVEKCCGFGKDVNWAVGIRTFNTLFKRYPDIDFWKVFEPFKNKYPLYVYLGGKGAEHVKFQYEKYLLEKHETEKYNLEAQPIAKIVVPQKPVSLIDFLKGNYSK